MKIDAGTVARFAQRYAANLCPEGAVWPCKHLFFAPHIPGKGQKGVFFDGFEPTETALIFIDNSISGPAESGLLVSETQIHYSLPYSAAEQGRVKGSFPLSELDTLDFITTETGIDVHMNGKHKGMIASLDGEELGFIKAFFTKIFRKQVGSLMDETAAIAIDASAKALQQDDPEIIEKLRAHDRHQSVFCLQCGYDGLMGVDRRWLPWYLTWWVIFPMLISSVGLVPAIALWLKRPSGLKFHVRCPNCDAALETI